MSEHMAWVEDWRLGLRVWLERNGAIVLGQGRLDLLEEIDRCHSISAAARKLGISYRHAWVTIQAVNAAAGTPLVVAATGGQRGGGARLTERGVQALALFHRLEDRLHEAAAGLQPPLLATFATGVLHVAAAVSLEDVLGQLVTDYARRQPAVKVRLLLGASDALAEQIAGGAGIDLFLSAATGELQRLAAAGLTSGPAVPLADNALTAIAASRPLSPVRRAVDLLAPEFRRIALATPSCPLGAYSRAYLEARGVYEQVRQRSLELENSRAVVTAVVEGAAEVGLVYGSAIRTAPACRVLFRARRLPMPIRYSGVVLRRAAASRRADDFLRFLTSVPARRRFRRWGFLPIAADSQTTPTA